MVMLMTTLRTTIASTGAGLRRSRIRITACAPSRPNTAPEAPAVTAPVSSSITAADPPRIDTR